MRKDAWLKVEGKAQVSMTTDIPAFLLSGPACHQRSYAHAEILSIDVSGAYSVPGVRAVVTGQNSAVLTGAISCGTCLSLQLGQNPLLWGACGHCGRGRRMAGGAGGQQ